MDCASPFCARGGELRVHVAKRLRGERRIVGADQEIGVGAKRLHLRFGVGHLLTHGFDLAGEPFACGACLLLLRRLLAHQVGLGNGIGDFGGKFRVLRQKVDDDDARLLHREYGEAIVIGLEHTLLRRHAHGISDDAEDADWAGAVADPAVVEGAWRAWREEVAFAEQFVAGSPDLAIRSPMQDGTTVALREVILHMVEEYARHLGHADLIRERIDGRVGQ